MLVKFNNVAMYELAGVQRKTFTFTQYKPELKKKAAHNERLFFHVFTQLLPVCCYTPVQILW